MIFAKVVFFRHGFHGLHGFLVDVTEILRVAQDDKKEVSG